MAVLFAEMFQPVNLPATILLGLVLVYWLLVIIGVVGVELFEFDLGVDAEGIEQGQLGLLPGVLQFFHLGDVPVTVFGSVFALLYWTGTMLANHYLNPGWSLAMGGLLLVGCVLTSLLVTRLVILPAVPFFRRMNAADQERVRPGQLARVSTSELTGTFGEVTIEQNGPPIVLNARCSGARLVRGDLVELLVHNPETNSWQVRLSKEMG